MTQSFMPGDVVQVRSGGPAMTIVQKRSTQNLTEENISEDGQYVETLRYEPESKNYKKEIFPSITLKIVMLEF